MLGTVLSTAEHGTGRWGRRRHRADDNSPRHASKAKAKLGKVGSGSSCMRPRLISEAASGQQQSNSALG